MRRIIPASFLVLEGMAAALSGAGLLTGLAGYDVYVVGLVLSRLLVGVIQVTGGWLLFAGRPPGRGLAMIAFPVSAALNTLETGFRLAPTNDDPTYRWAAVALYWVYAAGMTWLVRRLDHEDAGAP